MTALAISPGDVAIVWVDYQGSDWLAIYLGGDRVYEGHPPDPEALFAALGLEIDQRTIPSDSLRVPGVRGLPLRLPKPVPS